MDDAWKPKAPLRVDFTAGSAVADMLGPKVRIGDRLVPDRALVRFPGDGAQPSLELDLRVIDGVPQCRGLRIESVEGGREIRSLDLGAIRLREWVDDVFAQFASRVVGTDGRTVTAVFEVGPDAALGALSAFENARKGRGARSITPEMLERAAAVYREHFTDRPIQAVASAFGVSERSASGYITKARAAGLLPATTRGRKAV